MVTKKNAETKKSAPKEDKTPTKKRKEEAKEILYITRV